MKKLNYNEIINKVQKRYQELKVQEDPLSYKYLKPGLRSNRVIATIEVLTEEINKIIDSIKK